ncbi:hypothetical protein M231_03650 [Tremella mesenterica]|uniref:Cytoplasmic protein n=1 Tax=Tremella mesenterica TaxID=5217 RepID=A0A4Q1BMS2_TREME|nr:hypothetical protein M231_03650 [Tremella mesenterica]
MTYEILQDLPSTSTPGDYLRLHFDPSSLPKKRIVGFLACQRDPLLRTLRTKVISSQLAKVTAAPPQKGRGKKKGGASIEETQEKTITSGTLWEVQTEDTVIFPEGGGQPCDLGTLYIPSSQQTLRIEACLRVGLDAVHLVRVPPDEIPLDNLEGLEVDLEVDWVRRQDQMAIHTAQHLLSAVLDTMELPTLSWGMPAHPSIDTPYVELPRALTWAEVAEVEQKCNALIREDRKVWIDVYAQHEGGGQVGREFRDIPKDYQGGVIRHCNIEGTDRNACCGTQCPSLKHCEMIHLIPPSTPSTSSIPALTPTRLFFTAGPRARRYLSDASRTLSLASQAISVNRTDLVARVEKIDELRREGQTQLTAVRSELQTLVGEQAASQGKIAWVKRGQQATHHFDFLSGVTGTYLEKVPDGVIVATSALQGGMTGLVVVQSRGELAKEVFDKLKKALEGEEKGRVKGGGAKGRFMAKVEGKWGKKGDEVVQRVIDELREAQEAAS